MSLLGGDADPRCGASIIPTADVRVAEVEIVQNLAAFAAANKTPVRLAEQSVRESFANIYNLLDSRASTTALE